MASYSASIVVLIAIAARMCSAEPGEKNITFTSRNSKLLEVNYFDYENGLGVTVFSSKQSFHILTTNDKLLFCIEDAIYQDGNDLDQIVVIRGKPFLDHRRHNKASSYFITIAEAEELMEAAELKGNDQSVCKNPSVTKKNVEAAIETVVKNAITKSKNFHQQALRSQVNDFINDPHIPIIIDAALYMGEKEGIAGRDYPPVLPFYAIARLVGKLSADSSLMDKATTGNQAKESCKTNQACSKTCPPCTEKECAGSCGVGCNCWKMVCGDCCWHMGCCSHDECCGRHGIVSLACMNVLSFTCDQFKCPKKLTAS